ncbi:MAG: UDP binding domain-containing protein [Planctomycetota bacterium]|nr:UDP binding domain-containing protein [Planctomycetota bacterium]
MKRNDKIAVLGAAYKPDIDDPRESPAHAINKLARIRDIAISVHDPHVKEGDHEGMFVTNDLESALLGAKAVLLVTNHACYRSLSARFFREHMAGNVIADGRNWLNHQTLRAAGFELLVVGEPQITEDRASSGSVRTRAMFRSH